MPAPKVKWFSGVKPAEIYQSFNMKFSFANTAGDEIVQCHQWIKCRDFLHDAVRTMITGNKSSIYSFTFEKGKNPDFDMDKISMLISKKDVNIATAFRPKLTRSLKLINHFENLAGLDLSTIKKVSSDKDGGYKHVWLVTGPKFWLSAPYLVSLYTLLLRLGDKSFKFKDSTSLYKALLELSKKPAGNDNDTKYLKTVWNKIEKVIMSREEFDTFDKEGFSKLYTKKTAIGSFHNSTGIVSACSGATWDAAFNKKIMKVLKEENKK